MSTLQEKRVITMKLVIGNKNYSTWSLRPWLLAHAFGVEFEEVNESLVNDHLAERLGKYSPTNRVPVLIDKQDEQLDSELAVWDSLAICEYISEHYLDQKGWPLDARLRAHARSIVAEMHAGFNALRNEMPMNIRAKREIEITPAAFKDIQRIDDIFSHRQGKWLFGEFSIADCFYAPVILRFLTYGVKLSSEAQSYCETMLAHKSIQQWVKDSKADTEYVAEDEVGENNE
jgi:glutathione S-transferase